jgi:hypothetical protein
MKTAFEIICRPNDDPDQSEDELLGYLELEQDPPSTDFDALDVLLSVGKEKLKAGTPSYDSLDWHAIKLTALPSGLGAPDCEIQDTKIWLVKITFNGSVLNPFGQPSKANLAIVVTDGWLSQTAEILLGPRQWQDFSLQVRPAPDVRCRRQPVLAISEDDVHFGIKFTSGDFETIPSSPSQLVRTDLNWLRRSFFWRQKVRETSD